MKKRVTGIGGVFFRAKFGWVMDPEGNRLELWQPPAPKRKRRKAANA